MSMAAPPVLEIVLTYRTNCLIRARFPGSRFLVRPWSFGALTHGSSAGEYSTHYLRLTAWG